jgi:sugar-specific transcriptional regulator TrmB
MLKTLVKLGFKEKDAMIYLHLVLNGPQTARDIGIALNTYKRQVYRSLKKLETTETVRSNSELPAHFSAIKFEKVLDALAKENIDRANQIEKDKDQLIALWKSSINLNSSYSE